MGAWSRPMSTTFNRYLPYLLAAVVLAYAVTKIVYY
jgi:hypothetical protein